MGAVPGTSSQASPPLASFTSLGARSWNFLGRYFVHMSGGSTTCPSAEMSRYSRAIAPPLPPSNGGSRPCCARRRRSLTFVSAYFGAPGGAKPAAGPDGDHSGTPDPGGRPHFTPGGRPHFTLGAGRISP